MELSLAAVSLAVVICSLTGEFAWTRVLLSACALACIFGAFLVELMLSKATVLANSWLVGPEQVLSFGAMFLAALASRAGASEHISHLALTTLFWHVSLPKHDRKGMLVLVAVLQFAQTALVCGAHLAFRPLGAGKYIFIVSAGVVGILLPVNWLLPRLLSSAHTPCDPNRKSTAGDSGPASSAAGERFGNTSAACACARGISGFDRCHTTDAISPVPGRASEAAASKAAQLSRLIALDSGVRLRPLGTSSDGYNGRARSLGFRDSAASTQVSSWEFRGREGPQGRNGVPAPPYCQPETLSFPAASTATTACQTDDELLLWLFTGASTVPSAADEVRDEPRASYSGIMSPINLGFQFAELWSSTAKDGANVGGIRVGGGSDGLRSQDGGGGNSGGGDGGRSGGVGKYDSFTSVWSRCTDGVHDMVLSARASSGEGEGPDNLATASARHLEEWRYSNGSQQGAKPGGQQQPASAASSSSLVAGGWSQMPWHGYAYPACAKQSSLGVSGAGAPVALTQMHPRNTGVRGGGGAAADGSGIPGDGISTGFLSTAHLTQHHSQQLAMHSQQLVQPHRVFLRTQSSGSGRTSGIFGNVALALGSSAAAAAAAAATAFSGTAFRSVGLPADQRGMTAAATVLGERAAMGAGGESVSGPGSGFGSVSGSAAGAASLACRALVRQQRLQRSRTFNSLSPERSRALIGLARTDAGAPSQLPPPDLDEGQLGSVAVSVPSPYSEESDEEAVQRLRTLRALRRYQPELATSLESFAALLRRRELDGGGVVNRASRSFGLEETAMPMAGAAGNVTAARRSGFPTVAAAAATGGFPGDLVAMGMGEEMALCGSGLRRHVRRTQSSSGLLCGLAAAGGAEVPHREPSLRRGGFMHHQQEQHPHQQRDHRHQSQQQQQEHQHCGRQGTRHHASTTTNIPRRSVQLNGDLEAEFLAGVVAAGPLPQLIDASELTLLEGLPAIQAASAASQAMPPPRTTSSDGCRSVVMDAHSELSFEQHLLVPAAAASGAAAPYSHSATSSRRWSCASSSISSATVGSRGERMSMSAAESVTHGLSTGDGQKQGATGSGGMADYVRRAHQVQRSRSAGETGFRSSDANRRGRQRHWSQLPHQEHRRASLQQAWQTMIAEGSLRRATAAATSAPLPVTARMSDSDGVLPYGADPHGPPAVDGACGSGASAASVSPTGRSPTSPFVISAGVTSTIVSGRHSSGDGSGPVTSLFARTAGGLDSAVVDDRSVRLCKSLSERSLQQRLTTSHHYRRVGRTKSRFALLQDPTDGSAGGAGSLTGSSMQRISSGGSMAVRQLENVLEEQEHEQEEEQEDGPLAAAAAVASLRGSVAAGSRSTNDAGERGPSATVVATAATSLIKSERLKSCSGRNEDDGCGDPAVKPDDGCGAVDAGFETAFAKAAAAFGSTTGDDVVEGAVLAASGAAGAADASGTRSPRRTAWRSASELSFASVVMRRSRPSVGFSVTSMDRSTSGGLTPQRDGRDRRSLDSFGESAQAVETWLQEGDDSIPSRIETSVLSIDGATSLSPSLLGSGGSHGGSGGVAGSSRPSTSGMMLTDGIMRQRESIRLSMERKSSVARSRGGGSSISGRLSGGSVSGDGSADSDEELLDVLADEAVLERTRKVSRAVLRRLQEQNHVSVPCKTASFRFAAPIIPSLSSSAPLPTTSTLSQGSGGVPAPLVPLPTAAAAMEVTSPFTVTHGTQDSVARPPPGGAAATPVAAHPKNPVPDDNIAEGILLPPLAGPVLPELERERTRERPVGHSSTALGGDAASASGSPPPPTASGHQSPEMPAVVSAHPAPLSAQNLQHHTRHWEATSPAACDPAALALQLPSPSPSQSGPMDPLSDLDASPSAALIAAFNTAAETAVTAPAAAAASAVGSGSSAAPHQSGVESGRSGGGASGSGAGGGGGSGPVPRSVIAARLSMPLLPFNNTDATSALVVAAGRNSTTSALSRQTSNNTIGGLSACESTGSLADAAAALLMQSGDDIASASISATAAAASRQQLTVEIQHNSALSRSPSVLISGSNAGRSIVVRLNSGGGGGGGPGPLSGGSVAMFGPRQTFAPSTVRQPSKLSGGAALSGGDTVELEVEEAVLANRRMQDDRGVLLEEIAIDKVLGFGSMGMVYHGRLYDTKVVVKLIEHGTGVLGKEKERGRLARVEACVSRMLLHPNIVLTYDACTGSLQPGRLAAKLGRGGGGVGARGGRQRFMTVMVQEFCELGTLKDAVSKRKHGLAAWSGASPAPGSLPLLYQVALDIANGMKHLAALRIIHADLKAENVLLQKMETSNDRPHGFCAKVADFGLAMVLAPGEDEIRQGIHGTVSHMPPEAMKDTLFSLATDVFSFGVVLWELYTTESPYRGMAPHEVVEAVCVRGERPGWPQHSPPDLVELAEDCWHMDPHQRPSFADIVERLRQLLAPTRGPPERCGSLTSGITEESDELEMALRQQRRGAPVTSVRGGGGGGAVSDTGSDFVGLPGTGGGGGGIPTQGSSRGAGAGAGAAEGSLGVPRAAPRDPLGLLLWALCQFPAEPPLRVAGPSADSEQWVLQVEDMVLKSRQEHEDLPAAGSGTGMGSGFTPAAGSVPKLESVSEVSPDSSNSGEAAGAVASTTPVVKPQPA
ncbi:protein tyrosine kinase [Volvox africanus]|uniref:Protein tyrosine kinase n=1 Tax=Volvox africanus TaxID=51714 RepID=A0ABQ5RZT3_9CHLO|nr:protein tyrosine kinase [Volvox africanus]